MQRSGCAHCKLTFANKIHTCAALSNAQHVETAVFSRDQRAETTGKDQLCRKHTFFLRMHPATELCECQGGLSSNAACSNIACGAPQSLQITPSTALKQPGEPSSTAGSASSAAVAAENSGVRHASAAATWSDVPAPAKLVGLAGAPSIQLTYLVHSD